MASEGGTESTATTKRAEMLRKNREKVARHRSVLAASSLLVIDFLVRAKRATALAGEPRIRPKNTAPGQYKEVQFARQLFNPQVFKLPQVQTSPVFKNLSPANFFQTLGQLDTFGYTTDNIGAPILTARKIVEKKRQSYQPCTHLLTLSEASLKLAVFHMSTRHPKVLFPQWPIVQLCYPASAVIEE